MIATRTLAAALLLGGFVLAQDRAAPAPPTLRGTVTAYEPDVSITVETTSRGDQVKKTEFSIAKDKTRIEFGVGVKSIEVGETVSVWADKENPKAAARILAELGGPTLRGTVEAYTADSSITVGIKARGGQVSKNEFSITKGETLIELGFGVKAIEVGQTVSVWAEKGNRTKAVRILAEPEPPTAKGTATAYEVEKSITVEAKSRNGDMKSEFSIVKDKTQIDLGGAKALEPGMTVSVWADRENPKTAARILVQGPAGGRGRGRPDKPVAPAPKSDDPINAEPPDLPKVLKAFRDNLPSEKQLEWYTLDWVNTLGEAKERAAREKRPILWIQTNKEGDLFCSLC